MPLRSSTLIVPLMALLIASGSAAGAELYKWADENGVMNYSNSPPPRTRAGKPATLVEDTLSVYTPEQSVTEAIEARRQRAQKPPAISPPDLNRGPSVGVIGPPAAPAPAYDPCLDPNDRNCPGVIYDSSPVFHGRRRHQPLVQPQLPPGTLAGQGAGPGAYIPGQSGTAQPLPPRRSPGAGFTVQPERERDRRGHR